MINYEQQKQNNILHRISLGRIFLGLVILATIVLRFKFSWNKEISPLLFFTVQSNLLCALYWIMSPVIKTKYKPYISLGVTMYMTITGLVFSLLINDGFMQKLAVLSDQNKINDAVYFFSIFNSDITHYIMPILIFVDFLLLTDASKIQLKYAKLISIYPLAYFIFHVIYSSVTNKFIYPFLDPSFMGGWGIILILVSVCCAVFWLLGRLIVKANRYVRERIAI